MITAIALDDEPLALTVIQLLCDRSDIVSLKKTFTQPSEALKHLRKYPVDLLFCDIQMPSITGISFVKQLPQKTMVIFTTAFSEYAVDSYELNAIDYLLKPINQKRFNQAAEKAADYFNYINKKEQAADAHIFVRCDFSLVKIPLADILHIEGLADYIKIHIKDRKPITTRMPMKEMLEKLPFNDFVRVHRSFILPLNKIEAVRGTTVFVGNQPFPIGRTYIEAFLSRYNA